jgi:hypothetical protein
MNGFALRLKNRRTMSMFPPPTGGLTCVTTFIAPHFGDMA